MEINAYGSYKTNSADYSLNAQKSGGILNMQDFLNLLAAQIANQDVMNPMDNTEFVAQLAQFSSLQAMSDLTELALQGQATSLIGKNVVVADYNSFGELVVQEGIVQRVAIHSGNAKLYVNDTEYDYSNVMEVKEAQAAEDPVAGMFDDILQAIKDTKIKDTDNVDEESIPFNE